MNTKGKSERILDVCTYFRQGEGRAPSKRSFSGIGQFARAEEFGKVGLPKTDYAALAKTPAKIDPRCLVLPLAPPGKFAKDVAA